MHVPVAFRQNDERKVYTIPCVDHEQSSTNEFALDVLQNWDTQVAPRFPLNKIKRE